MAYSLVVDTSNFKPYDFGEAFQVLKELNADKIRRELELNRIYEEMGKYSLPENTKYSEQLKAFWDDVDKAAESFYSSRGSGESKRAIRDMWKRYNREIVPIKQMVENYNRSLETLAKLGPDAIVANKDQLSTIENYYGGMLPTFDYRSANNILLVAAKTVAGLDNALMQSPLLALSVSKQYLIFKQLGLNGQQALGEILKHNPQLNNEAGIQSTSQLISALDNIYLQYAFKNGTPENNQIWQNVVTGAIMGIQAPKYSTQSNRGYETPSEKRQLAYQRGQMLQKGYVWDEDKLDYVYDEEAAMLQSGVLHATLPDGITYDYDPKKKQWTSQDPKWDGVPRTSAQLIAEKNRLIAALNKEDSDILKEKTKELGEPGERTEEQYLALGRQFKPLNYTSWSSDSKLWEYNTDDSRYYYSRALLLGGSNHKLSDKEKENIKPEIKSNILTRIKEQNPALNIGWEDLDIWEDNDAFSNNHYRIVIKGTGEKGLYKDSTVELETPAFTTRGATLRDSTRTEVPDTTLVKKPRGF